MYRRDEKLSPHHNACTSGYQGSDALGVAAHVQRRPLRFYAGLWQGVPLRVLAPQRWPGQSGPKRKLLPFWNLPLVTLKPTAAMGFYYTPYMQVVRGLDDLARVPWSEQN